MQSIVNKVLSRIRGRGRGWAFSANDFISEFSRDQLDNALSDLLKQNKIRSAGIILSGCTKQEIPIQRE